MTSRRRHFVNHLHPEMISSRSLNPFTTLGLGIACLTCLGVLVVTGLTLSLYYVPDQEQAYEWILHISTTLSYGGLIRDLHYLAANALIILSVLHVARVFLTGSYKARWLNWGYGLCLLFLILLANYTGYLLPWNQISYWAVKVGAHLASYFPFGGAGIKRFMLGGEEIGSDTLARSFAFHSGVIPLLIIVLTSLHLWRIRKDGGLAASHKATGRKLPANPWLYRAEGAVALLVLAALLVLSLFVHAPIFERAAPQHPPNPAKAPWYFVGVQEMVSHSALLGGVAVPCIIGLFLLLAPLIDRSKSPGGNWFARDRWLINVLFLLVLLSQLMFIIIGQWFRGKNWAFVVPF